MTYKQELHLQLVSLTEYSTIQLVWFTVPSCWPTDFDLHGWLYPVDHPQ
jgi:hypothetical protein